MRKKKLAKLTVRRDRRGGWRFVSVEIKERDFRDVVLYKKKAFLRCVISLSLLLLLLLLPLFVFKCFKPI